VSDVTSFVVEDRATIRTAWVCYGLAQAAAALADVKEFSKLPGFGLAVALVEKELMVERTQLSNRILRSAVKAGHDIVTAKEVRVNFHGRELRIEVEMPDLADMAASDDA
jgi:hypothetical protein